MDYAKMIDHTLLKPEATKDEIKKLCEEMCIRDRPLHASHATQDVCGDIGCFHGHHRDLAGQDINVRLSTSWYLSSSLFLFQTVSYTHLATLIEWITACIMQRLFGEVWWDYHNKPLNYKGILCLESTIAWGFYTLILFGVLQNFVERIVETIPRRIGEFAGVIIISVYLLDFLTIFFREKRKNLELKRRKWIINFKILQK